MGIMACPALDGGCDRKVGNPIQLFLKLIAVQPKRDPNVISKTFIRVASKTGGSVPGIIFSGIRIDKVMSPLFEIIENIVSQRMEGDMAIG
jgi:hypothetical protein